MKEDIQIITNGTESIKKNSAKVKKNYELAILLHKKKDNILKQSRKKLKIGILLKNLKIIKKKNTTKSIILFDIVSNIL